MADPDPLDDPIEDWLADLDREADRLDAIGAKARGGSYTDDDAIDDLEQCTERLIQRVVAGAQMLESVLGLSDVAPSFNPGTSTWTLRLKVTPKTVRPVTPMTTGLRRLGGGKAVIIQPQSVTFDPPTLTASDEELTITVDMSAAPTGIYRGTVVSTSDQQTELTEPIMPTR